MKYLIKIKPLDKFFFGREQTFGDNNYLAKSHYLPQQTQVLGMLRKEFLIQQGLLTQKRRGEWVDTHNYKKAKELVGTERFDISAKNKPNLGVIKKISPLFLINKEDEMFYFSAKDCGVQLNSVKNNIPELVFKENQTRYKAKEAKNLSTILISHTQSFPLEKIFLEDEQVGIKKNRKGGSDDDAFFKKTSYKLDRKFSFAFVLESDIAPKDAIVSLGGERSLFKMEIVPDHPLCNNYEHDIKELYESDPVSKLILLSDTYIEASNDEIFSHCDFAITESVAIRTINAKVGRQKNKDEKKYRFQKSIMYNFFKQGSVFYNQTAELEKLIANDNLQHIGYNKYIIIEGESK